MRKNGLEISPLLEGISRPFFVIIFDNCIANRKNTSRKRKDVVPRRLADESRQGTRDRNSNRITGTRVQPEEKCYDDEVSE